MSRVGRLQRGEGKAAATCLQAILVNFKEKLQDAIMVDMSTLHFFDIKGNNETN